jgi:hypothetical protein
MLQAVLETALRMNQCCWKFGGRIGMYTTSWAPALFRSERAGVLLNETDTHAASISPWRKRRPAPNCIGGVFVDVGLVAYGHFWRLFVESWIHGFDMIIGIRIRCQ